MWLIRTAQGWSPRSSAGLEQAYRLYVLARAGQPEVGAMNRLREAGALGDTERWMLAAAYQFAGLPDVAAAVAPGDVMAVRQYRGPDYTFGSTLRDHAIVLQSLAVMKRLNQSEALAKEISAELSSGRWYATQSVAYALMSMAQLAGAGNNEPFTFARSLGGKTIDVGSSTPVYQAELPPVPMGGEKLTLRNTSKRVIFATVSMRGIPAAAAEATAAAGLSLSVYYSDADDNVIDAAHVRQGSDLVAHIEVRNDTSTTIDNIALTHIVPAGWEIRNDRLEGAAATGTHAPDQRRNPSDPFNAARDATRPRADYVDIRDDRLLQYFSLGAGETIRFDTHLNAAYRGRYYLPSIQAEAMYDAAKQARTKGMWTEVE